jgi:hypothetical protein
MKRVIPFLAASIVYHYDWLRIELSPLHPIWNSRIITTPITIGNRMVYIANHFKNRILTGFGHCPDTNIHATGIPCHLVIAHEVNELKRK